jgi:hypothetical protein
MHCASPCAQNGSEIWLQLSQEIPQSVRAKRKRDLAATVAGNPGPLRVAGSNELGPAMLFNSIALEYFDHLPKSDQVQF